MINLNEFIPFISTKHNIYIRKKGEKVSILLEDFIKNNPNNWTLYDIDYIEPDNNDLIINLERYF